MTLTNRLAIIKFNGNFLVYSRNPVGIRYKSLYSHCTVPSYCVRCALTEVLTRSDKNWSVGSVVCSGRLPFDQKFRKFRVKSEWKGHFPESHFGMLAAPRKVVPIFRKIGITGKFCPIRPFHLGPVSPRPNLKVNMATCTTQQFQCAKG